MMDIMVGFGSGDDEKYRNKKKSSCYILEEERKYGKYIFNPEWSRAARIKIDRYYGTECIYLRKTQDLMFPVAFKSCVQYFKNNLILIRSSKLDNLLEYLNSPGFIKKFIRSGIFDIEVIELKSAIPKNFVE